MAQFAENFGGITLKSLLENPSLLLPPPSSNVNNDGEKEKDQILKEGDFFYSNETADMAAAFLGPTLWDKTLSYESDLKLEYMDIDEFLKENGIQFNDQQQAKDDDSMITPASPESSLGTPVAPSEVYAEKHHSDTCMSLEPSLLLCADRVSSPQPPATVLSPEGSTSPPHEPSPIAVDINFPITENDVALATAPGQDQYDPRKRSFTDEELKPQPMVKKSRKIYVPEDLKDDKYWERRRKNNIAAKRSRDARRIKENQIVIRASYLEKENGALKDQVLDLKKENMGLKKLVASFEKQLNELKSL